GGLRRLCDAGAEPEELPGVREGRARAARQGPDRSRLEAAGDGRVRDREGAPGGGHRRAGPSAAVRGGPRLAGGLRAVRALHEAHQADPTQGHPGGRSRWPVWSGRRRERPDSRWVDRGPERRKRWQRQQHCGGGPAARRGGVVVALRVDRADCAGDDDCAKPQAGVVGQGDRGPGSRGGGCRRAGGAAEIAQVHDLDPQPGDTLRPPAEASRARAASRCWTLLYVHGKGRTCGPAAAGKIDVWGMEQRPLLRVMLLRGLSPLLSCYFRALETQQLWARQCSFGARLLCRQANRNMRKRPARRFVACCAGARTTK
ncbi:unnamed protein product, partial [Ectocarpus fasciculatus]